MFRRTRRHTLPSLRTSSPRLPHALPRTPRATPPTLRTLYATRAALGAALATAADAPPDPGPSSATRARFASPGAASSGRFVPARPPSDMLSTKVRQSAANPSHHPSIHHVAHGGPCGAGERRRGGAQSAVRAER